MLAAIALCSATAASEPAADDWSIERFEWRAPDSAPRTLTIKNPHGDIRARTSKDGTAEILGLIQFDGSTALRPAIRIDDSSADVVIETHLPAAPDDTADQRRVDISVLVPRGTNVVLGTDEGLIEAKNLRSDIEAHSRFGRINLSTSGTVTAHNEHGEISVLLTANSWPKAPTLSTQTGNVDVLLPTNTAARISAATSGHITSDYSMTVDYDASRDRKQAVIELGDATQTLTLQSARGDLRILRSPLATE